MSTEPYIGVIAIFAGNFAPRGWAFCQGQYLSIAQNTALFSILGTTYGGDGQVTFALPDLRGRIAIGTGQGPGLSSYTLGQAAGSESVSLLSSQLPAHTHALTLALNVKNFAGNSRTPVGNVLANEAGGAIAPYSSAAADMTMASGAVSGTAAAAGSSQPTPIIQPYLTINYIIALEGLYPSRN